MSQAFLDQENASPQAVMAPELAGGTATLATAAAPTIDLTGSDKRLEDRTVKELRMLASKLDIRGRSKLMHKEELINVIRRRW